MGIDISKEPIPIVPAQHYQCGGVITDLDGATGIDRLYAAGEVACTGVHGANRLASNSLLEAMVFGYRAAAHTLSRCEQDPSPQNIDAFDCDPTKSESSENKPISEAPLIMQRAQKLMQRFVGIVRTTAELLQAQTELNCLQTELAGQEDASVAAWEARNCLQVGALVIKSALIRHESRGLHYTLDYPESLEAQKHDTILQRR